MIRKDYIMRLINELMRVLLEMLFRSRDVSAVRKTEIFTQVYDVTGFNRNELLDMTFEEIIGKMKQVDLSIEKLELIGLTFLNEVQCMNEEHTCRRSLINRSLEILKYVDQNSTCFSLERRNIITDLENESACQVTGYL
jgi:hypothetical protein